MITVCDFASFRSDLLHFLDIAEYYFYLPFFGPNMTHYLAVFRPLICRGGRVNAWHAKTP